jgi:outer membrane lipoprotein-sorting protein
MSAHEQHMAELLEQYLEELETNPNAQPPKKLDPQLVATIQKTEMYFASEPNPEFVASLRSQIEHAAMSPSARAKQNAPRRGIFALPRWSFAGVAAALLIALGAFALWSTRPAPVNAQELLSHARSAATDLNSVNVKSFEMVQESYSVVVDDANAPPTRETRGEMKTWYAAPTRWRIETQSQTTNQPPYKTIQIADGAAQFDYNVYDNTVNIQVAESKSFPSPSVLSLDFLQQDMSNCYTPNVVGEETIAGRAAYKVDMGVAKCRSASAPELNGPHTLWIDKETFFVLKSEIRALHGDRVTSSFQVTSIRYNVDLPNDLFQFTPPANAQVNDMRPKPAPSVQDFQTQLSALAPRVEFPIFAPAQLPNDLQPRAPMLNEIEKQIELAYVPADEVATNTLAMQHGVSIIEKRADYETLRNWTDGAEAFALDNAQGWIRRGDFDPNVGTGSNSAAMILRDGTLISISSFAVEPDALVEIAKSLQPVPGSHTPLPNPTAPTLDELRAHADYPILIPTYVPSDLTPAPPTQNQIEYYRADGMLALIVQNAKQGNGGMEQEPRFKGEMVKLPNGREVHQLMFEPQIVILWWNQDGGYTALEGHGIARDEMLKIAASMSSTAALGKTQAPPAQPTPTPVPAPSFKILRPTWLPEEMKISERNVPTPNGRGAGIEIRFDPHPDGTPHDMLTLTEMPKAFAESFNDPQFQKKDIGGRDVTFNKIGSGCVLYSWVQGDVALTLTNAYDPPGAPGPVRYTCAQMEKIIASIQ